MYTIIKKPDDLRQSSTDFSHLTDAT